MLRVILIRLALSVPLLIVVTGLSFVLIDLIPGDAAVSILGAGATPAAVASLREELRLNDPLIVQYLTWAGGALRGDLGTSLTDHSSVAANVFSRLGVTLSLALGATAVAVIVGLVIGVRSAHRPGPLSGFVEFISVVGFALPVFWVALVLVLVFAVTWPILPAVGYVQPSAGIGLWLRSLVLPVIALALGLVAGIAKQTRDSMMEALSSPYVFAMRANGLSERRVVWKHALRNASLPVVTLTGLLVIGCLTGAVTIEQAFALPGIGSALVAATASRDIPTIQGCALVLTLLVVAVNLVVDLSYSALNPKVRQS